MKYVLFIISLALSITTYGQDFNEDKVTLSNFLKRMYTNTPFEGVKIIEDYDRTYLISVVSLEKANYTSESIMIRVAQTKAQSQASRFFNGSQINSEFIIKTTESTVQDSKNTIVETIESIRENSVGFVNEIELLVNFNIESNKRLLFIYYKEINKNLKK
ncbi:MAG: hypothetical protein ABIO44_06225 [Saprospiraceae bacterium]